MITEQKDLESLLQEERRYTVNATCGNCGNKQVVVVPYGKNKPEIVKCNNCGCNTVHTGWGLGVF